jgi:hypothetical protein
VALSASTALQVDSHFDLEVEMRQGKGYGEKKGHDSSVPSGDGALAKTGHGRPSVVGCEIPFPFAFSLGIENSSTILLQTNPNNYAVRNSPS